MSDPNPPVIVVSEPLNESSLEYLRANGEVRMATAQTVREAIADADALVELVARKHKTTLADARQNYVAFEFQKAGDTCYYRGKNGQWLMKRDWVKRGGVGLFSG